MGAFLILARDVPPGAIVLTVISVAVGVVLALFAPGLV
jgi:hypothetical protein